MLSFLRPSQPFSQQRFAATAKQPPPLDLNKLAYLDDGGKLVFKVPIVARNAVLVQNAEGDVPVLLSANREGGGSMVLSPGRVGATGPAVLMDSSANTASIMLKNATNQAPAVDMFATVDGYGSLVTRNPTGQVATEMGYNPSSKAGAVTVFDPRSYYYKSLTPTGLSG